MHYTFHALLYNIIVDVLLNFGKSLKYKKIIEKNLLRSIIGLFKYRILYELLQSYHTVSIINVFLNIFCNCYRETKLTFDFCCQIFCCSFFHFSSALSIGLARRAWGLCPSKEKLASSTKILQICILCTFSKWNRFFWQPQT